MNSDKPNTTNSLGVAGFTVSIIGLVTCGVLCPIGLLLSLFGLSKEPRGLAVAGTIIGGIGSLFLIPVLLVLILVPLNSSRVFGEAKLKAAQSQLAEFRTPLAIYQLDVGTFPENNQGLQALRVAPPDLVDAGSWNGPYLSTDIPLDPWGGQYGYELLSENQYRLFSCGPDGKPGTDDDIVKVVVGDGF